MASPSMTPDEIAAMKAYASQSRDPNLIACAAITLAFAYLVVGLRFLSRRLGRVRLSVDDYLILLALPLFTAFTAALMCALRYGFGKHIIFVTNIKGLVIALMITQMLYPITMVFIKMSILMLYRRAFPSPTFHVFIWIMAFIVIGYNISGMIASILRCLPMASQWDASIHGTCINVYAVVLVGSIMNIVTDFTLLGMPIPFIATLHMSRQRKIMLICVFGTGACSCFISIARCVVAPALRDKDATWGEVSQLYTSLIDISFGIFSACVPIYKPLWSRVLGHSDDSQGIRDASLKPSKDYMISRKVAFQSEGGMGERYAHYLRSGNLTTTGWSELSESDSRSRDDMPLNAIGVLRGYAVDVGRV